MKLVVCRMERQSTIDVLCLNVLHPTATPVRTTGSQELLCTSRKTKSLAQLIPNQFLPLQSKNYLNLLYGFDVVVEKESH